MIKKHTKKKEIKRMMTKLDIKAKKKNLRMKLKKNLQKVLKKNK
jgi:hypothetical protein